MSRKLTLQAIAFGLITLPSLALYWADAAWLVWGLMALVAAGMVIGLRHRGGPGRSLCLKQRVLVYVATPYLQFHVLPRA